MGVWGMGIAQSDEFCEFYDSFMELYDEGKDIAEIPDLILAEYRQEFEPDDGVFHDAYLAIAKAQWMCGSVQPEIMRKVEDIISSGANIDFYRELEATESDLKKRRQALEKFLLQLQTPRSTVRKRHPPAKPRELPPMESGDVFSYKAGKADRIFIFLGTKYIPWNSEWEIYGRWVSFQICILQRKYKQIPALEQLMDEPVGLVCGFLPNAFPANDKLNRLGKIELPERGFLWQKIPAPPCLDEPPCLHVRDLHTGVSFLVSKNKKLFTYDYDAAEEPRTLRTLFAPSQEKDT